MQANDEGPPLLAKVEVIIGNGIPVFGVILLGWQALTVVFLYVLDGWLCILGLGASVMLQSREEMRSMVPKTYGRVRRILFLIAAVGLTQTILSIFALVPGVIALAHMDRSPGEAVTAVFADSGVWVPVALLLTSHGMRIARSARGSAEGIAALPPKRQMALFTGRLFLMMFLAWLAAPGFLSRFLVPMYVTAVAAVFTYSDLYPQRFLSRFRLDEGIEDRDEREPEAAKARAGRRRLPK